MSSSTTPSTQLIRSESQLCELMQLMATNPHGMYQQLSAMAQDELALLAMQLLSKSAAPLVGPAASSRVGVGSAATMRLTFAGRSMLSDATNSTVLSLPLQGDTPLADAHGSQRNRARGASVHLLSSSPPLGTPSVSRLQAVDLLEDAESVRKMSTHELEDSLQVCHTFQSKLIPLKDIYFYQDYVCNQFMDSRFLSTTIEELRQGTVTPESIPPMDCLQHRGRWYGMGNRRLACYHYVYQNQPTRLIPVRALVIPDHQPLYPQGTGTSVKLGGGHLLDGQLMFTMRHCCHV